MTGRRRTKACITFFIALIFFGSTLPCLCFATTFTNDHHKRASSDHSCCGSNTSDENTNSDGSSHDQDSCCSGCTLTFNSVPEELPLKVDTVSHHSPHADLFLISTDSLFHKYAMALRPRVSLTARPSFAVTATARLSILSRWII